MSKDPVFQILAKGLADIGLWRVVALAVELTRTCQRVPGLEVFGYGLVQQCPLGVALEVVFTFNAICNKPAHKSAFITALKKQTSTKA